MTKPGVPCHLCSARCPAHKDRAFQDSLFLPRPRTPGSVPGSRSLSVSTAGRLLLAGTLFSSVSGDEGGSTKPCSGDPIPEHLQNPQPALWVPDQRLRFCSPVPQLGAAQPLRLPALEGPLISGRLIGLEDSQARPLQLSPAAVSYCGGSKHVGLPRAPCSCRCSSQPSDLPLGGGQCPQGTRHLWGGPLSEDTKSYCVIGHVLGKPAPRARWRFVGQRQEHLVLLRTAWGTESWGGKPSKQKEMQ